VKSELLAVKTTFVSRFCLVESVSSIVRPAMRPKIRSLQEYTESDDMVATCSKGSLVTVAAAVLAFGPVAAAVHQLDQSVP
jgi:hypothetical protein